MNTNDFRLTGSQAVWFAEVRHLTNEDGPEHDYHQRPDADGGPHFNQIRAAKRWCETKLAELIAAGVHPSDLEAICDRGRWTWPHGRLYDREWVEDDPAYGYHCRPDRKRDQFTWVYDGDPTLSPEGETP